MNDSFLQYLIDHNAQRADSDTRNRLWKQHRKAYLKSYNQKRKQRTKRIATVIDLDQYKQIQDHAGKLKLSTADFLRKSVVSTLNNSYVIPDEELLQEVVLQLNQISSGLYQIAFALDRNVSEITYELIEIQQAFKTVETNIIERLKSKDFESYVIDQITADPELLDKLIEIINTIKDADQDDTL